MCASMNAFRRFKRSLVLVLYSKSMLSSSNLRPSLIRQPSGRPSDLQRIFTRGGALFHPPHDSLRDPRRPEHVVGEVEIPVLRVDRVAAHALAVARHVLGLG